MRGWKAGLQVVIPTCKKSHGGDFIWVKFQVFLTHPTMANENPPMDVGGLFKVTNGINN
jgi:hypothetical protein